MNKGGSTVTILTLPCIIIHMKTNSRAFINFKKFYLIFFNSLFLFKFFYYIYYFGWLLFSYLIILFQ